MQADMPTVRAAALLSNNTLLAPWMVTIAPPGWGCRGQESELAQARRRGRVSAATGCGLVFRLVRGGG